MMTDESGVSGKVNEFSEFVSGVIPTQINSVNFALGFNVAENIRSKIVNGNYIDLSLLLRPSNFEDLGGKNFNHWCKWGNIN